VRRAACAMAQANQREKVARWTRSMMISNEPQFQGQDSLICDFAAVILVHARHLTELTTQYCVATNSMLAIVGAIAGGSLRDLTIMFGPDSVAIFAQIGRLPMLRSLTLMIKPVTESSLGWEAFALSTADPWNLPHLNMLSLILTEVQTPAIFFSFLGRCCLKGLTEVKLWTSDLSPDATQALRTTLHQFSDLVLFEFSGARAILDVLIPDLSCRSLHIYGNGMPSAHTAASLSSRIRNIVVHAEVDLDAAAGDPFELTADDVREFLRSLGVNRSAQSELAEIRLNLEVAPSDFGYFSWRNDDPTLATFLGTLLPLALRLRDQGVTVVDYEDCSLNQ
jgi:hypothetical protein